MGSHQLVPILPSHNLAFQSSIHLLKNNGLWRMQIDDRNPKHTHKNEKTLKMVLFWSWLHRIWKAVHYELFMPYIIWHIIWTGKLEKFQKVTYEWHLVELMEKQSKIPKEKTLHTPARKSKGSSPIFVNLQFWILLIWNIFQSLCIAWYPLTCRWFNPPSTNISPSKEAVQLS